VGARCATHHAMAYEDNEHPERVFSLAEATELLPQLNSRFTSIKRAKGILLRTTEEIKKASAKAQYSGGSSVGSLYVQALHEISANLQAIHELGVVVKDVNMGLCDFPFLLEGRVVYLCWKFGEPKIRWWHEISLGYKDRHPLEESAI
jgi:hypothetical protein